MDWLEYFAHLQKDNVHQVDDSQLQVFGFESKFPEIIKSVSFLCDRALDKEIKKILFIIPEISDFSCYFVLYRLLKLVCKEKKSIYDIFCDFHKGDKIQYDKAVAEFLGFDNGMPKIRFKDLNYYCKLEDVPFFQKADKNKKITKYDKFIDCKKRRDIQKIVSNKNSMLSDIANLKGGREKAQCCIFPNKSNKLRRFLEETVVDVFNINRDLCNIINVNNMADNMVQKPDLLISKDFDFKKYDFCEEYIVDGTNCNLDDYWYYMLSLFDDKSRFYFFISEFNNINLNTFISNGFQIFRLNKNTITSLPTTLPTKIDCEISNCFNKTIEYKFCISQELDNLAQLIKIMKKNIKEEAIYIQSIYAFVQDQLLLLRNKLFSFVSTEQTPVFDKIESFGAQLEKAFGNADIIDALKKTLDILKDIYSKNNYWDKYAALKDFIINSEYNKICLIMPPKSSQDEYNRFRHSILYDTDKEIILSDKSEFCGSSEEFYDVVIVPAWLYENDMKLYLLSCKSSKFVIFMYSFEQTWMLTTIKRWNASCDYKNEMSIIQKIDQNLTLEKKMLFDLPDEEGSFDDKFAENIDDIETEIAEIQIKKYQSSKYSAEENCKALPFSLSGGYFAFYSSNHKILSVTSILQNSAPIIEARLLHPGDIIVFRDSGKDLIREGADTIFQRQGITGIRQEVELWRTKLKLFTQRNGYHCVITSMLKLGFKINFMTLMNWINNDEFITPMDESTFLGLGKIVDNNFEEAHWASIFEKGRRIKNVHIKVGRFLSSKLSKELNRNMKNHNLYLHDMNFPYEFNLKEIGKIRLYKIISIGKETEFPCSLINTLRREEF